MSAWCFRQTNKLFQRLMSYSGIKDNVAIITGAGEGIGYAVANLLAAKGASVILNDLDSEKAERAAEEINKQNPNRCL